MYLVISAVGSDPSSHRLCAFQAVAIERCSYLAEPLCAQLATVWESVGWIPAPRCDHRQYENPALALQVLIDSCIVLADFFGRMGKIEFDRPTAARLEVDEQQPVLGGEYVARVRLAVKCGAGNLILRMPACSRSSALA
jgi:hypothetical protein